MCPRPHNICPIPTLSPVSQYDKHANEFQLHVSYNTVILKSYGKQRLKSLQVCGSGPAVVSSCSHSKVRERTKVHQFLTLHKN